MKIWRNNGLSIVLFALFLASLAGQTLAGHRHHNQEQREHGAAGVSLAEYVASPTYLEATMENWESEFLQLAFYVLLTVKLYQKGSAESKDPDMPAEVDRKPDPARKGAPGPVRSGGLALWLYQYSLGFSFAALFVLAFWLHAVGGAGDYNDEQAQHGETAPITVAQYMATSRFWFESFQNWQSEFLAIGLMVVLSIFLRQHGSPESKPVDAAHSETGNGG